MSKIENTKREQATTQQHTTFIEDAITEVSDAECACRERFIGKQVVILSKYNGQPFGRSKPMLTGKVFEISGLILESNNLYFFLEGQRLAIGYKQVKFVKGVEQGDDSGRA